MMLQDSVSVRNSVRQGESDYYYLPIDITGKDVTITVTSLSGDPVRDCVTLFFEIRLSRDALLRLS
jgi:hypothetical protein